MQKKSIWKPCWLGGYVGYVGYVGDVVASVGTSWEMFIAPLLPAHLLGIQHCQLLALLL